MSVTDADFGERLSRTGFGTSGVRALVADLTPDIVCAYGLAFADWLMSHGLAHAGDAVLLGHDLRPSSPDIVRAVVAALAARGLDVEFCGALSTPAIAFLAMQAGVPAIVVTGSHIPFDRNGIKFYKPGGEILKDDEAEILARLGGLGAEAMRIRPVTALPSPSHVAADAYTARYAAFFPANLLSGKTVGLYEHSSVARDLLRAMFEGFGATVIPIGRSDTFVAVDTEAVGETDQAQAFGWAKRHKFDVLISTDGDGDRPLIGDETGRYFRGDAVGILTAHALGARTVVTPVNSNTALEKSGWFAAVRRTRIGSPQVIGAMNACAADPAAAPVVGFEANGGFLTATRIVRDGRGLDPLPTRDSVLPMLALMQLAFGQARPMSSLHAMLPARFTASDRLQHVDVSRVRAYLKSLETVERAQALFGGLDMQLDGIDLTDGVRMTAADGRIVHLRMSGNAPEMRCYTETGGAAESVALAAHVLAAVAPQVQD